MKAFVYLRSPGVASRPTYISAKGQFVRRVSTKCYGTCMSAPPSAPSVQGFWLEEEVPHESVCAQGVSPKQSNYARHGPKCPRVRQALTPLPLPTSFPGGSQASKLVSPVDRLVKHMLRLTKLKQKERTSAGWQLVREQTTTRWLIHGRGLSTRLREGGTPPVALPAQTQTLLGSLRVTSWGAFFH